MPIPTITSITPADGPVTGGEQCVVVGTSLDQVVELLLGGVAMSGLIVDSPTQLRAQTGAHAVGLVDLDVQYVEVLTAAPTITSPTDGLVTTATSVAIVVSSAPGASVYIYQAGVLVAAGTADGTGVVTLSVPLSETAGTYPFTAKAQLAGDLLSNASSTVNITASRATAVSNANTVSAVGLRSALRARVAVSWLPGSYVMRASGDGGYGSDSWLVDTYLQALAWPAIYTPPYARPIIDKYATAPRNSVNAAAFPYGIGPDGTAYYATESGTGSLGVTAAHPILDEPANLTLLVALMSDRGDATVFPTYKTRLMEGLDGMPRSGGLVAVPATFTATWSKEDAVQYPVGGVAMPSILTAIAYSEVARLATATGDTALAADATTKLGTMKTALAALRRTSPDFVGFYNASAVGSEAKPHIVATALMVMHDLCASSAERDVSARALVDAYNAGALGTNGAIRYLASPYAASTMRADLNGTTLGTNIETMAWWTELTGWVARAMSLASAGYGTTAASALLAAAANEMLRQQRASSDAPWEGLLTNPIDVTDIRKYYAEVTSFLQYGSDVAPAIAPVVLNAANGYSAVIDLNAVGHRVSGLDVSCPSPGTYSVNVFGTPRTDSPTVLNPGTVTYGVENSTPVVSAALVAQTVKSVTTGAKPDRSVFGGKLRVTAGGTNTDVDSFSTDTSANYTRTGTWAVTGGQLVCSGPANGSWNWAIYNPRTTQDGAVEAKVTAGAVTGLVSLIARYVDANNFLILQVDLSNHQIYLYEYKAGVLSSSPSGYSGTTFVANTQYTFRFEFTGQSLVAKLNGTSVLTWTTPHAAWSGQCAVRASQPSGTLNDKFDDFTVTYSVTPPADVTVTLRQDALTPTLSSMAASSAQPVPPGFVVEIGGVGGTYYITGDDYTTPQAVGQTVNLYDKAGNVVATGVVPAGGNKLGLTY